MSVDKETQAMNLMLVVVVSKMPADDRSHVENAAEELRRVVEAYGDHGAIAFSLVGTEMAMKP